ncbi:MAG: hypothetical protein RIA69_07980 [Cyclobacteriaceae bacterium]
MTASNPSVFELSIDKFIQESSPDRVANALRCFIIDVCENPKSRLENIFRSEVTISDPVHRIKPAGFKKLIEQTVILHLESVHNQDRASIIYKYLNSNQGLHDVEAGLKSIYSECKFPGGLRGSGQIGKYRAAGNVFTKKETTPSESTLKFCLAILDIHPDDLKPYLDKEISERQIKKTDGLVQQPHNHQKKWLGSLLIVISLLIIVSIFWQVVNHNASEEISSSVNINSSELFDYQKEVNNNTISNSISLDLLSINTIDNYAFQENGSTPVNKCLIRFRITNRSEEFLFPDNLFISIQKEMVDREILIHQQEIHLEKIPTFPIDPDKSISQLNIINDDQTPNIPPNTMVTGVFMIACADYNRQLILQCQLQMTAHSKTQTAINLSAPKTFSIIVARN